jgi:hypothetical protein
MFWLTIPSGSRRTGARDQGRSGFCLLDVFIECEITNDFGVETSTNSSSKDTSLHPSITSTTSPYASRRRSPSPRNQENTDDDTKSEDLLGINSATLDLDLQICRISLDLCIATIPFRISDDHRISTIDLRLLILTTASKPRNLELELELELHTWSYYYRPESLKSESPPGHPNYIVFILAPCLLSLTTRPRHHTTSHHHHRPPLH